LIYISSSSGEISNGLQPLAAVDGYTGGTPSDVTRMDAHHIEWLSPIEDEAWKDL